jgi:hypothetical protein
VELVNYQDYLRLIGEQMERFHMMLNRKGGVCNKRWQLTGM